MKKKKKNILTNFFLSISDSRDIRIKGASVRI